MMTSSTKVNETVPGPILDVKTWTFTRGDSDVSESVTLPHDAMIGGPRRANAPGGADIGWFEGQKHTYRTTVAAPDGLDAAAAARVVLRFEGIQGEAQVSVDGVPVGAVRSGYHETELDITDVFTLCGPHDLEVAVDDSKQPASRWYAGAGLFRPVTIVFEPTVRFALDGVRFSTVSANTHTAQCVVDVEIVNPGRADATTTAELWDGEKLVAQASAGADRAALALDVDAPRLWSDEAPALYTLVTRITVDGTDVCVRREQVGIRTLEVSAARGLLVNGRRVVLRGACIHHDNGLLGAASHPAANRRRIARLKAAGFNAVRSAHHPMSRDLLDACDEFGGYVLDEFTDFWTAEKTSYDGSHTFLEDWRADAATMVAKDRNRASVVMYSIGNEIPETATPAGVQMARQLTEHFHQLDSTRPVTLAINLFLNAMVAFGSSPYAGGAKSSAGAGETAAPGSGAGTAAGAADGEKKKMAGSTEANVMVNQIGRMMSLVARLPLADKASRDAFSMVDVAGYNYGVARYSKDVRLHPERVTLGTETMATDAPAAYRAAREHPQVIGDFVWTGWDYLGEAGVSTWVLGKRGGMLKPYPYLVAGPGMFDILGEPDITLRLAQAAWGRLDNPIIGVRPVDWSGEPVVKSAWRSTNAISSWSWRGCEGRRAEVEVYSQDEEVVLLINGRIVGRKRAGERAGFVARFSLPYEPGTLEAVALRGGQEVGRTRLSSASGPLSIQAVPESETVAASTDDLAYIPIRVADAGGVTEMLADTAFSVSVTGPGELVGLGSSDPAPRGSYTDSATTTYRGRALAIVRPTGQPGVIEISLDSVRHGACVATVTAV